MSHVPFSPRVPGVMAVVTAFALLPTASLWAQNPSPDSASARELVGSVATGVHFQGFAFGARSDVDAAQLLLVPLAYQRRLGGGIAVDGYTAYARGTVRRGDEVYTLSAPVDTWARLRWTMTPWAVLAVGVNLPTGRERQTTQESIVAGVLSNDLLGFREGSWGLGTASTVGISTARQFGTNRVSLGGSYRFTGSFNPRRDTTFTFAPGNETRFRLGLERELGTASRLTAGLTWQHFDADRLDGKNLFRPGVRVRGDASLSLGEWNVYGVGFWRASGDLTVPVVSVLGGFVRDTVVSVGWQALAAAGVSTSLALPRRYTLRPSLDLKYLGREERSGRGWMGGVGAVLPVVVREFDLFPAARLTLGGLVPTMDSLTYRPVRGAELSMVVRRGIRRASRRAAVNAPGTSLPARRDDL